MIAAEPALAAGSLRRAVRRRAGGDRRLHRRQVAVHARPLARRRRAGGRARRAGLGLADDDASRAPGRAGPRPRPARRLQRDLGQARPAHRGRAGARPAAPLPDRAHARLSPALAPLGAIAVQHHERLDGSGYPRGLAGRARSRPPGTLLAAADAYHAMPEPRPHRPALPADAGRGASCAPRSARAGSTPTRSTRCCARPGTRSAAAQLAGRADRPRGRGAAAARARGCRTGRSPQRAGDLAQDRRRTTSSTSTPRSASPTGPGPACSR